MIVGMSDQLDCDLSKAIVPTCLYVDQGFEGQRISFKMEQSMYEQASALGFETCVYYGFAADRVIGWVEHHKSCVDTRVGVAKQ